MQKVNACSQEKALCAELEDELRLLTTIVRAHEETCDYTRDKVVGLVEKARTQPVYTQCPPQLVSIIIFFNTFLLQKFLSVCSVLLE